MFGDPPPPPQKKKKKKRKTVLQCFGMKAFKYNCGRQGQGQVLVGKWEPASNKRHMIMINFQISEPGCVRRQIRARLPWRRWNMFQNLVSRIVKFIVLPLSRQSCVKHTKGQNNDNRGTWTIRAARAVWKSKDSDAPHTHTSVWLIGHRHLRFNLSHKAYFALRTDALKDWSRCYGRDNVLDDLSGALELLQG